MKVGEYIGPDGHLYRWRGGHHESFDGIDQYGNELWVESALPGEAADLDRAIADLEREWRALPWWKRLFWWAASAW